MHLSPEPQQQLHYIEQPFAVIQQDLNKQINVNSSNLLQHKGLMKLQTIGNRNQYKTEKFFQQQQKTQREAKVTQIFNKIGDIFNKQQITQCLRLLESTEERSLLIDKILQRRQEITDAEQLIKMSQLAPLMRRFLKKVKGCMQQKQSALHGFSKQVSLQSQQMQSYLTGIQSNNNEVKKSSYSKIHDNQINAQDTNNQLGTNIIVIPSSENLNDINENNQNSSNNHSEEHQSPNQTSFKEEETRAQSNSQSLSNQQQQQQAQKKQQLTLEQANARASMILAQVFTVQAFQKRQPKKQQSINEITEYEEEKSEENKQAGNNADEVNSPQPYSSQAKKRRKKGQGNLPKASNNLTDRPDQNLNVNLKRISEKSKALIENGKIEVCKYVTGILKDVQKKNLSSHFHSKSLKYMKSKNNQMNELANIDVNVNTYQEAARKVYEKESKMKQLHNQQKETVLKQSRYKKNYSEVIENDLFNYLMKSGRAHSSANHFFGFTTNHFKDIDMNAKSKITFESMKKKVNSRLSMELTIEDLIGQKKYDNNGTNYNSGGYIDHGPLSTRAAFITPSNLPDNGQRPNSCIFRFKKIRMPKIKGQSMHNSSENPKLHYLGEGNHDNFDEHNDSFASFTETKLDNLYRQSKDLQEKIENLDQLTNCANLGNIHSNRFGKKIMDGQREKEINSLIAAKQLIAETNFKKLNEPLLKRRHI